MNGMRWGVEEEDEEEEEEKMRRRRRKRIVRQLSLAGATAEAAGE